MKNLVEFVRSNSLLILITILAFSLRLYQLGLVPPSLNWDEVSHGYNASSILKTGRDEYGYKFPLYFRSFDDYKPPLYTYLTILPVALFGLSDFSTRLTSAILGSLTIIFTYLLAFELFKSKKSSLLSAFFLSISPWHIQFSRVAFETNIAIFWTTSGTWAFLQGIKNNGLSRVIWLTISAFLFGINLFVYHNARLFIPLFALILLVLYMRNLLSNIKALILPLIITCIFLIILLPILFSTAGSMRFHGTNIFSDPKPKEQFAYKLSQDPREINIISRIIHNRRFAYIPVFITNYFSHFRPNYLFFNADMDRHHAPEIGLLYLWDIPFLITGFFFLFSKNYLKNSKIIIGSWFLLAPVASALTWGVPHSLRSLIYVPIYQILIGIGIYNLINKLPNRILSTLFITFCLIASIFFYLHQYYFHLSIEFSKAWIYGRKEAAIYSNFIKSNFERVIVSTNLEQPHLFWLYYLKYDPKEYQQEGGTVSGGFLEERNKFDKFYFKKIDYNKQKLEAKTLFVGIPGDFPKEIRPIKKINYLNGEEAIFIVDGTL